VAVEQLDVVLEILVEIPAACDGPSDRAEDVSADGDGEERRRALARHGDLLEASEARRDETGHGRHTHARVTLPTGSA
jgi:hypothetical protein